MLTPTTVYGCSVAASLPFPPMLEATPARLASLVMLAELTARRSLSLFRCQKSNSPLKGAAIALWSQRDRPSHFLARLQVVFNVHEFFRVVPSGMNMQLMSIE